MSDLKVRPPKEKNRLRSAEGPAKEGEHEEQREGAKADEGEGFASAEKAVAGFGLETENHGNEKHTSPGNGTGQAGVLGESGKRAIRWLIGGEPPGQDGRETRRQHKGENLAADPALHFGYGLGLAQ